MTAISGILKSEGRFAASQALWGRSGGSMVLVWGRSDVDLVNLCMRGTCNINFGALNFLA